MPARAIPRIKTRDGRSYVPTPEAASNIPMPTFRHDPYGDSPSAKVYLSGSNSPRDSCTQDEATPLPGTLHQELWGLVSFLPYPKTSFVLPPDTIHPSPENGDQMKRIFFGQLPYYITEMQLSWLMYTFGGRHAVFSPERIIKRNPRTGVRQVTGCIHAFASAQGLATMASLCHKKLLIDDTGVWYCQNEEEKAVLADYCLAMKQDIRLRPWERPYDSVVVQEATSGAQSYNATYLNSQPQQCPNGQQKHHFDRAAFAQFQHGHSRSSTKNYQTPYHENQHIKLPAEIPSDGEDYVAQ